MRRLLLSAGALMLFILGVIGAAIYLEYPGGMSGGYPARDHDPRLAAIARKAVPIITLIERFYDAHGSCPQPTRQPDLAWIQANLGDGMIAEVHPDWIELRSPSSASGWRYVSSALSPNSCALSIKLGWDPELVWSRQGSSTRWAFAPGDGRDDEPILLDLDGPPP